MVSKLTDKPVFFGRLHQVRLSSPQPVQLAHFYRDNLGLKIEQRGGGWLCEGAGRGIEIVPGVAKTLQAAVWAVDESSLDEVLIRLSRHETAVHDRSAETLESGAIGLRDPAGNLLIFGRPRVSSTSTTDKAPRLQHVVFACREMEPTLAFYTDVIGFTISDRVLDEEGRLRSCFLRSDHEHHSVAIFKAAEDRLDHHCYELRDWNDIKDMADSFAARRVRIQWGPGRHGPGNNLFIFVHDPDGNWVELSAELDVVAPDRPEQVWPHEERTLNIWGPAPLRS
jgi:catechol 2,3-dioxygenase